MALELNILNMFYVYLGCRYVSPDSRTTVLFSLQTKGISIDVAQTSEDFHLSIFLEKYMGEFCRTYCLYFNYNRLVNASLNTMTLPVERGKTHTLKAGIWGMTQKNRSGRGTHSLQLLSSLLRPEVIAPKGVVYMGHIDPLKITCIGLQYLSLYKYVHIIWIINCYLKL